LRWTANTFLVAIAAVIINLIFASMAGYALARMYLPGKNLIFGAIILLLAVPAQVTFISNYLILRDLGLVGSLWGMVIWIGIDMARVFLMKQFFESIPREIEEAALIDGANPITTFFRIILPMATPALGALTILTFQGVWNEFFKATVILSAQQNNYTLPLGLNFFRSSYGVQGDWGAMLASAFLSMIPVVILFVVFQRYFVEGVSTSAVKG
jgi:multiple sugar transport system permease protein